jgi:hypothetical protein
VTISGAAPAVAQALSAITAKVDRFNLDEQRYGGNGGNGGNGGGGGGRGAGMASPGSRLGSMSDMEM